MLLYNTGCILAKDRLILSRFQVLNFFLSYLVLTLTNSAIIGTFCGRFRLLTLKDCYYEEQMGALIESMLMQAHVVGGG